MGKEPHTLSLQGILRMIEFSILEMMNKLTEPPIIAIVGPTAAGKTGLAIDLALSLSREVSWAKDLLQPQIVNTDAYQAYRLMDIGTAKPTVSEQGRVKHHGLDVLDPTQESTVAEFQERTLKTIDELLEGGIVPILVGGSGLYLKAVIDQLAFPGRDDAIRQKWEETLASRGIDFVYEQLYSQDEVSACRIGKTNTRRIIRALEVIELTGEKFSSFLPTENYRKPTIQLGLDLPREHIDSKVTQRVSQMWDQGLVAEVRAIQMGAGFGVTASRAVGYKEILDQLSPGGSMTLAKEQIITNTRRLTRKQMGWFGRDTRVKWFDATCTRNLKDDVIKYLNTLSPETLVRTKTEKTESAGRWVGTRRPLGSVGRNMSKKQAVQFTKGHATKNDFVLLKDYPNPLELSAELVKQLCDRNSGVGGDGVINVVPVTAELLAEFSTAPAELTPPERPRWCMDYRNADGSLAQMCGNGTRVFAAFLEAEGLADFSLEQPILTRAGIKRIQRTRPSYYRVNMGKFQVIDKSSGVANNLQVQLPHSNTLLPAWWIDMGNPHAVVVLPESVSLSELDLSILPEVFPLPASGINIEFVEMGSLANQGSVRMRVYERGVGETQSCGTGACAVGVVAQKISPWQGDWRVGVPGGELLVEVAKDQEVHLSGPVKLMFSASISVEG